MSVERAHDLFTSTFGVAPLLVASAPGRVNLIGEHTDYNGGEVLPIAIEQRTWVAMDAAPGGPSQAVSEAPDTAAGRFDLTTAVRTGEWWDYVQGTLLHLAGDPAAAAPVRVAVVSDLPQGAGLSSSAALEVATARAAAHVWGEDEAQGHLRLAQAAHRAETEFVGVSCGMMDQAASALARRGHALRLWCDTGKIDHVSFERAVLVIDTATPRALRQSAFNERRESCARALAAIQLDHPELQDLAHATLDAVDDAPMTPEVRRRARHVVQETRRVAQLVDAVRTGRSVGQLLAASHASLRDDYECSTPELDWVVEFAMGTRGIDGARLTGAGWGGCAIAVGTPDGLRDLAASIIPAFTHAWKRAPRTWLTSASHGAMVDWVRGS